MAMDLTTSFIDRKNILNNDLAVEEIQSSIDINGIPWNSKLYVTKEYVAYFFNVDPRTIDHYIKNYRDELKANGMEILKGEKMDSFIQAYDATYETDSNSSHKTRSVTVFDFLSFLNMAMLLSESDTAHALRQIMLNIVIDIINNKRNSYYLNEFSTLPEDNYGMKFTDALKKCVESDIFKYVYFTDLVYTSFFKENAKAYKKILDLKASDSEIESFYSKIIDTIASYKRALADAILEKSDELGRALSKSEAEDLFHQFEKMALWKPQLKYCRTKMARKDQELRDVFHYQLPEYIQPLDNDEHQKFLATAEHELERLMLENRDVLKRLKECE